MALKSPTTVILETSGRENPEKSLGDAMNAIRSWLDRQKIQPVDFKTR